MVTQIISTLFSGLPSVIGHLVEALIQCICMFLFKYTSSEAGVYTFTYTQLSPVGELILVGACITIGFGIVYGTFRFVRGLFKGFAH